MSKLKSFKNLIAMSALAAATSFGNTAKAETNMGQIEDVKETPNGTLVIKKNSDAKIGDVPTPWMFGRPDGQSAFATTATQHATNATDNVVVDETGTNMYVKAGDLTEVHGRPITNIVNSCYDQYINTCSNLIESIQDIEPQEKTFKPAPFKGIEKFKNSPAGYLQNELNKEDIKNSLCASFTENNITNIMRNYLEDGTDWSLIQRGTGLRCAMELLVWANTGEDSTDEDYKELKEKLRTELLTHDMFDSLASSFVDGIQTAITKIQQFSLSKDGIPSTTGKEIVLPTSENFRLLAARNGALYTITFEKENEEKYWPIIKKYARTDNKSPFKEIYEHKCNKSSQEPSVKDVIFRDQEPNLNVLLSSGLLLENSDTKLLARSDLGVVTAICDTPSGVVPGNKNGGIVQLPYPEDTGLNGPITGLSTLTNGNIVACSTNGCVELEKNGWGDWVKTQSLSIPEPPNGTFKIIDNRGKPNGALLYVTRKNIGILSR